MLCWLAACAYDSDANAPSPQVSRTDSSGVPFVRVPPLSTFSVEEIRARRLWSTAPSVELFRVSHALFLPDGDLVIADDGATEILQFGADGAFLRRIGRSGDGPGEFRSVQRLLSMAGQGFAAFDARLSRLSYFGPDGELNDTQTVPAMSVVTAVPLVLTADRGFVTITGEQRIFRTEGERRDTVPLVAHRPGQDTDTLGTWLGLERAFASSGGGRIRSIVPIGFARTAYYAAGGGRFAVGSSDSLNITVYSEVTLAPVLRLVAPPESIPVTQGDVRSWREAIGARVPGDSDELAAAWANGPVRSTLPAFEGMGLDPSGRLWVGRSVAPRQESREWKVFDADGQPMASVRLPANDLTRPGMGELLSLGDSRLALLRRDELGVESVEVWEYESLPGG